MMKANRTCRECGIPLGISRTMRWNPDGTITQVSDPAHRMIFFESDNLDRMWRRLSQELAVTQEHIWELVISSKSRATRAFLYHTLPWYVNVAARIAGYRTLMSTIEAQGLVMGYGKITLGGQYPRRGRPERVTVFIEDPYSLPLFCGDFKGSAEVLERVSRLDARIGRASVFRALDLFTSLSVIRPTYIGTSQTPTYVLMPDGHHHHILCTQCGRVIEFDECGLGDLAQELALRLGFRLTGHLVEFYGVCADCQRH